MKLLNSGNTKTKKGEKFGWRTYGLHLAPEKLSGFNACPWASEGCAAACLNTAGRGMQSNVQKSRIAKTKFFFEDRQGFMAQLHKEITAAIKSAERAGLTPCFRLNLTSDIPWENVTYQGLSIFEHFPEVRFYDYTKGERRMWQFLRGELPPNYHLTFSRSEKNDGQVYRVMQGGGNVAVVFRNHLPFTWGETNVVNGDTSDLRFLDPKGCVVGLIEKGKAKKDKTGFVV